MKRLIKHVAALAGISMFCAGIAFAAVALSWNQKYSQHTLRESPKAVIQGLDRGDNTWAPESPAGGAQCDIGLVTNMDFTGTETTLDLCGPYDCAWVYVKNHDPGDMACVQFNGPNFNMGTFRVEVGGYVSSAGMPRVVSLTHATGCNGAITDDDVATVDVVQCAAIPVPDSIPVPSP